VDGPVETLELPDGRFLHRFADGRELVTGTWRPHPHPVAGCEWLGAHRTAPRPRLRHARPAADTPSPAEVRAVALLESLLDPEQLRDYRATGSFWVPTPSGPVRLGRLYALVHRPDDAPDIERVLCVVPHAHRELPLADIWANLLLMLAVEPSEFFRVARLQEVRRRRWP
jgi:hypothetical protein